MTDATNRARVVLREWVREVSDTDPEQRAWKLAYWNGMLSAAKTLELLSDHELSDWRQAATSGIESLPSPEVDPTAVDRYLSRLLDEVKPLTRTPNAAEHLARELFADARSALEAAGLLPSDESQMWRRWELERTAPWLTPDDVDELMSAEAMAIAIAVPASTPEEEAEDRRRDGETERRMARGAVETVLLPRAIERVDGTALVGLVLREESVELHFHHVDRATGHGDETHFDRFREIIGTLAPPDLTDDLGTRYEPIGHRPGSAHGSGVRPDPNRPTAITGMWRYLPAVPQEAAVLQATLAGHATSFSSCEADPPRS
jgi:hypothetical protein